MVAGVAMRLLIKSNVLTTHQFAMKIVGIAGFFPSSTSRRIQAQKSVITRHLPYKLTVQISTLEPVPGTRGFR